MAKLYTIGFTKKGAQQFFDSLKNNGVNTIIDIRLNNTSQLSGFAKYPDIKFFLKRLNDIDYIHDLKFSPTEEILKGYKNKLLTWQDYVESFERLMLDRNIDKHILNKYSDCFQKNYCLLCSEDTHENCHRSLVAAKFNKAFDIEVKNI